MEGGDVSVDKHSPNQPPVIVTGVPPQGRGGGGADYGAQAGDRNFRTLEGEFYDGLLPVL